MLTTFTQVPISESTVQRLTETTGLAALAVAAAEAVLIQATWPPVPVGPDTAVVSVDGAMVPLVGGVWAEVKTLAVGVVEPGDDDQPAAITDLSYVSRLVDAQQFQTATLGELHRRGIERADQVVAVTDGAAWIQGWVDFHCPAAVRILDFAHAAQRLAVLGQAEGSSATAATRAWFATMQHRLKHEGMAAILPEVRAVAATHPDPLAQSEHLAYLMKRVDQMAYPTFQAGTLWVSGRLAVGSSKVPTNWWSRLGSKAQAGTLWVIGRGRVSIRCWPCGMRSAMIAGGRSGRRVWRISASTAGLVARSRPNIRRSRHHHQRQYRNRKCQLNHQYRNPDTPGGAMAKSCHRVQKPDGHPSTQERLTKLVY